MVRVLHIISDLSQKGGGPARSSQGLVAGLNAVGVETYLVSLRPGDAPWVKGVDRFEQIAGAGAFPELLHRIKPDIVHIHGIWDAKLHAVATLCCRWHIPYVIAPRGMLEPWSLKTKWLKKRIARFLYQDRDLHRAAALHATAESEAAQFRKLGFKNPIIVSPNGVNVPERDRLRQKVEVENYSAVNLNLQHQPKRALFVSRMHPKKGVLELVESWARVKPSDWQCELVYTLNGDTEREYETRVKRRVHELGLDNAFIFTGPLSDDEKWKAYSRANLFALPTYSENFGIVVPEALYAGVPVITTKGTPWQELVTHKCGWWIDLPPIESLDAALRDATSTSTSDLDLRGRNGRLLVEKRYTWPAVCKAMVDGYQTVLK